MLAGTMMFRLGDSFGGREGKRIIQAGILNDIDDINALQPSLEMFVADRVAWLPAIEGIPQHEGMPA
jgi:hypothetical protein